MVMERVAEYLPPLGETGGLFDMCAPFGLSAVFWPYFDLEEELSHAGSLVNLERTQT